jgi:hypothetical protein
MFCTVLICVEGNWRIRTNKEISELMGHEDIVSSVRSLRIRWLGGAERMNINRMPKVILNAKNEGGGRRGRPRKRWFDDVECDTKSRGIRNRRLMARYRGGYTDIE